MNYTGYKKIDASTCTEEFTFGHDGEPFYVPNGLNGRRAVLKDIQTLAQHRPNGDYGIDTEYFEQLFGVPFDQVVSVSKQPA